MSLILLSSQDYHEDLLDEARGMVNQKHFQLAVIVAQVACEIYTEQTFVTILKKKEIEALVKAIRDVTPGYNLKNDKVRNLYVALSGDKIQDASFWPKFIEHAKLRDKIVHQAKNANKEQAENSCQIVEELINHIEKECIKRFGVAPKT